MNDQDFKKIVTAHKVDLPDEGFSARVTNRLPERKNMLPQIVMAAAIMIGFVFVFVIQGVTTIVEQINDLTVSISHLQMPSPSSVIIYLVTLVIIKIIGYSIMKADG